MIGALMRYDRAAGDAAAALRDTAAMRVLGPASDVADQWPLLGVCAATIATGAVCRDRRLVAAGVHMTMAMLAATALKNLVKDRIDRTRPLVVAQGGRYTFQRGDHDVTELDSFPSGHTAGATAVARAVASHYPAAAPFAAIAAATVALIQLPRAKHYPIDLAAGAVAGLTAEAGVRTVLRLARSNIDQSNR